jgi:2-polyprenyl-6-methoxyphenol hydroxylase-like FAD-dependent oxidoreductase
MTTANDLKKWRALIVGGSLGGLFAGNLLRRIGWDVDIFERSPHDLDSRGGGIVLQPEVVDVLRRAGTELRASDLGVRSAYRTVFRPDGSIQSKHFAPQTQTSWSLIYTTLKAAFGDQKAPLLARRKLRLLVPSRGAVVCPALSGRHFCRRPRWFPRAASQSASRAHGARTHPGLRRCGARGTV